MKEKFVVAFAGYLKVFAGCENEAKVKAEEILNTSLVTTYDIKIVIKYDFIVSDDRPDKDCLCLYCKKPCIYAIKIDIRDKGVL